MRKTLKLAIILLSLGILVHDAGSGRMSVFQYCYDVHDLIRPLCSAASRGELGEVAALLRRGADPNAVYGCGTPLRWAVASGHRDVAALLIARGADVNVASDDGWTPLHEAARQGRVDILALLLAAGADINARMLRWGSPGRYSDPLPRGIDLWRVHSRKRLMMQEIQDLSDACRSWDNGFVGWPLPPTRAKGWAPLHEAVACGRADAVGLLIERGADIDARDDRGETPLGIANAWGEEPIAAILRTHGGKTGKELDG